MFKRVNEITLIIILIGCSFIGCSNNIGAKTEKSNELKIGITVYKQEDKFISCITNTIEEYVIKKENETKSKITINVTDAKGNSTLQNSQVDKFLSENYDIICVNIVDRTSASVIINKAKKYDVPVIFFNREPVEEDINLWDKVYYIGAKAERSGSIQGEIVLDEYNKNNSGVDKNNDGKIQYVMLEGEPEHQDSLIRTESTIKKLTNFGIEVEKLASDSANWQSSQAYEKTTQWINEFGNKIEVVFSNNDDMALGAISAFENANIKLEDRPIIVGIDGIPEALNCIKEGTLKGTVFNDYIGQAEMMIDISYDLKYNEDSKLLKEFSNIRQFKTNYKKITSENVDNYIKNEELE
ncbi:MULTISPECIES: substrate-binding domain-containing protein [Clostridia]|uniref:D-galactose/methyl-galactoside binding periplasmic protein MglB n=1 Tax=Clostridium saudiense TaxID=1414720 RepID=A0ABS2FC92_9CLOT|nr:galactose ABC transporter substrate-binding protein [Paraclostridium bifermentans]MBM6817899.1 galactose ABC transporter substrate-binding protein [Clostridium saudiense]